MISYYQILGISHTASQWEVRCAFREKAKFFHPDINTDKNAKYDFQKINEAYQVLINPKKRSLYDWKIRNYKPYHKIHNSYSNVACNASESNPVPRRTNNRNSNSGIRFEKLLDYFLFITLLLTGVYALLYGLYRLFIAPVIDINPYPAIVLGMVFTFLMLFVWHKKTKLMGN